MAPKRIKTWQRKTGYIAWIANRPHWHRTYEGAYARFMAPENFATRDINQVIEVETGRLVAGRRR